MAPMVQQPGIGLMDWVAYHLVRQTCQRPRVCTTDPHPQRHLHPLRP